MDKLKAPIVRRIEYRRGQMESLADLEQLTGGETLLLEQPNIPDSILQALRAERILELAGDYGRPSLGSPIEVDLLQVQTEAGVHELRLFNRGLMLFTSDDEIYKRLHRFLEALGALNRA
jgi:hypothetical protein